MVPQSEGAPASVNLSGGEWNGIQYYFSNQPVRIEGIELPYYFRTVDYHAVTTLRSGKTIVSNYADVDGHGGVGGLGPAGLAIIAGVKPFWPVEAGPVTQCNLDLACYLERDIGDEDRTGATIKGEVTFEIRRAYLVGSMPFRPNASLDGRRCRYEIVGVEAGPENAVVHVDSFHVPLILRGDLANWTVDNLQLLPVYRPYGEALQEFEMGSGILDGPGFAVLPARTDYKYGESQDSSEWRDGLPNATGGWRHLPPDWTSGAELMFFDSEPCGRVTLPYEIDNVDLSYR